MLQDGQISSSEQDNLFAMRSSLDEKKLLLVFVDLQGHYGGRTMECARARNKFTTFPSHSYTLLTPGRICTQAAT
jgi:hypothetical protein